MKFFLVVEDDEVVTGSILCVASIKLAADIAGCPTCHSDHCTNHPGASTQQGAQKEYGGHGDPFSKRLKAFSNIDIVKYIGN